MSYRQELPRDILKLRLRPSCGHKTLQECPLDVRDWTEVYRAYQAFKSVCVSVAEDAHARETIKDLTNDKCKGMFHPCSLFPNCDC
jgi:hypothetical protein